MMINTQLALAVAEITREAGAGILEVYESGDFEVLKKSDDSPLTRADTLSHNLIVSRLAKLTPEIPVISEEGAGIDYGQRRDWSRFYLVDPLDGTKSFINRNAEFTVNIALLENGIPVLGAIYAPVAGDFYFSCKGEGAYKVTGTDEPEKITVASPKEPGDLIAVISKSHRTSEQDAFMESGLVSEFIPSGSSLKFCLVAEGRADIYPRFGPLWEWDTAAGHAILREAGGRVVDLSGSHEITYNKKDLLHKGLIALPEWLLGDMVPCLSRIEFPEVR